MSTPLRSLRILGLHPVEMTQELFDEALDTLYPVLEGEELEEAKQQIREHFAGLYLLEIEVTPDDAEVDWAMVTQPVDGRPEHSSQAPWDERPVTGFKNRWAFFLHYVQLDRPLRTPLGEQPLPKPTPIPKHLEYIEYVVTD